MKSATTWKRQAILIQFYTWGAPAEKWGALLAFWGAFDKAEKIMSTELTVKFSRFSSQLDVDHPW